MWDNNSVLQAHKVINVYKTELKLPTSSYPPLSTSCSRLVLLLCSSPSAVISNVISVCIPTLFLFLPKSVISTLSLDSEIKPLKYYYNFLFLALENLPLDLCVSPVSTVTRTPCIFGPDLALFSPSLSFSLSSSRSSFLPFLTPGTTVTVLFLFSASSKSNFGETSCC